MAVLAFEDAVIDLLCNTVGFFILIYFLLKEVQSATETSCF